MSGGRLTAALLAAAVPVSALAQGAAVPPAAPAGAAQAAPAVPSDTPEEIAKDAARDLTPTRFYNRPGATRAEYDAAWQSCRLVARGSLTPTGAVPYYYNPSVVSPLAAGIAGGIGGAIGAMIAQGEQRRANRQSCLLIRGWRLVEPSAAQAAPVLAMPDAARAAYLDRQIGAADVKGAVTERTRFAPPDDPALRVPPPVAGGGTVWLGKAVDPAAPLERKPGEAMIVAAFRRVPAPASMGRSALVHLVRYDLAHRDLIYRPRDWKKLGDKTTYVVDVPSGDKTAVYEVRAVRVTPGDYVLDAWSAGAALPQQTNCFGAPTFHVAADEVVYLGDFVPFVNVKLASRGRYSGLVYAGQSENARATLAARQPALAQALTPVAWRDRATYACAGMVMDRLDIPDAEPVSEPPAVGADAATGAAR